MSQLIMIRSWPRAIAHVDAAAARFGKHTIFFADCAKLGEQHKGARGLAAERKNAILKGETNRQHLGIPILKNNIY